MTIFPQIAKSREFSYEDIDSFKSELVKANPKILMVYNVELVKMWQAGFIDDDHNVHRLWYKGFNYEKDDQALLRDFLGNTNCTVMDGIITMSEDPRKANNIYILYIPWIYPELDRLNKAYKDWIDTVKALPVERTVLHYVINKPTIMLDATIDNMHHLFSVNEDGGYTFKKVLEDLITTSDAGGFPIMYEPVATRNDTPAFDWFPDYTMASIGFK